MSFFIKNKTECIICHKIIGNFKDAILLPFSFLNENSNLSGYAKNYADRKCFDNWENKKEFVDGYFEVGKRMVENIDFDNIVVKDSYFTVVLQENEYCITDFYSIFEMKINYNQAKKIYHFIQETVENKIPELIIKNWKFKGENGEILISELLNDLEVIDEIRIPSDRFNDYVNTFQKILKTR